MTKSTLALITATLLVSGCMTTQDAQRAGIGALIGCAAADRLDTTHIRRGRGQVGQKGGDCSVFGWRSLDDDAVSVPLFDFRCQVQFPERGQQRV